jgi:hypothetical protein
MEFYRRYWKTCLLILVSWLARLNMVLFLPLLVINAYLYDLPHEVLYLSLGLLIFQAVMGAYRYYLPGKIAGETTTTHTSLTVLGRSIFSADKKQLYPRQKPEKTAESKRSDLILGYIKWGFSRFINLIYSLIWRLVFKFELAPILTSMALWPFVEGSEQTQSLKAARATWVKPAKTASTPLTARLQALPQRIRSSKRTLKLTAWVVVVAALVALGYFLGSSDSDETDNSTTNAASSPSVTCQVRPAGSVKVNERQEPNRNAAEGGELLPGQSETVIAQTTGNDGMIWWQLSNQLWLRSDVVAEDGNCQELPVIEP